MGENLVAHPVGVLLLHIPAALHTLQIPISLHQNGRHNFRTTVSALNCLNRVATD